MDTLFDFGIVKVRGHMPGRIPGSMWSWSILFRGDARIWHVVRRTGRLKVWA